MKRFAAAARRRRAGQPARGPDNPGSRRSSARRSSSGATRAPPTCCSRHRDDAILATRRADRRCASPSSSCRALTRTKAGRTQVALPAVLDWSGGSTFTVARPPRRAAAVPRRRAVLRHGARRSVLVADPRGRVAIPGRRIARDDRRLVEHDGALPGGAARTPRRRTKRRSSPPSPPPRRSSGSGSAASTTTSSALIEFGDEAYVVTPFTTDYENILLSLSLIGDWTEFMKFPDQGTTIATAIEQGDRACSRRSTSSTRPAT